MSESKSYLMFAALPEQTDETFSLSGTPSVAPVAEADHPSFGISERFAPVVLINSPSQIVPRAANTNADICCI